MLKYTFLFLLIVFIIAMQIGFLSGLSYGLAPLINLPLILIVFVFLFYDIETAIIAAMLTGFILDLYSPFFFGFFIILVFVELIIIKLTTQKILSNKNLLSFVLINIIAIAVWHAFYLIYMVVLIKFNSFNIETVFVKGYLLILGVQVFIHLAIVLFIYKISPRLRYKLASGLVN